jgi:hypothetical protein
VDLVVLVAEPEHFPERGEFAVDGPVRCAGLLAPRYVLRNPHLRDIHGTPAAEGSIEVREPVLRLGEIPRPRRLILGAEILRQFVVPDLVSPHRDRLARGGSAFALF